MPKNLAMAAITQLRCLLKSPGESNMLETRKDIESEFAGSYSLSN